MRWMAFTEDFGGFADLAFARQKHQHVARTTSGQLVHRIADGFVESILVGLTIFARAALLALGQAGLYVRRLVSGVFNRPPAHFYRIQTPGDLDHRRRLTIDGKVRGKALADP